MRTVNLSSGSKGNSTFVESEMAKILIDDGLSYLEIKSRLSKINVGPSEIDAILLTHEHVDHIGGVQVFLKKNKNTKVYIPLFVKEYNIKSILSLPETQIEWYRTSDFFIKDVTISSFILPHDSKFCVGYSLYFSGRKVSIATDLGFISDEVINYLSKSNVLYLESNHDETLLLKNPKYPAKTKKRILSNVGHLSNVTSGHAIAKLVKTGVLQVVLSHLSEENNTPVLAYTTVKRVLSEHGIIEGKNVCVDVAYQHKIGTIFNL